MRIKRVRLGSVILAVLLAGGPVYAQDADAEDIRLGQIYAKRLEAQYRLVQDAGVLERVARIGKIVAAASDRPALPYTYKVLDLEVPNAVSLPGGFIYVTRGMFSYVRSDHELAAVLAHETAHAAHRHQQEMIRRSSEATFWTVLVALLSRDAAIATGAQLVSASLLSGYSRDLERDADLTAIGYLVKTPFTPVGELTLMERLARDEQLSPPSNAGAFRDHPTARERVGYIEADLKRRGIPIVRRVAANYLRVTVLASTQQSGPVGEILVDNSFLLFLPDSARVRSTAAQLERFFNTDPDPSEVSALQTSEGWDIVGGRLLLLNLTRADAEFMGLPLDDAAREIVARLQWVIQQDLRTRQFNG